MSYEAWGDGDEFNGPEGYVTDERAAEMVAEETAELREALIDICRPLFDRTRGDDDLLECCSKVLDAIAKHGKLVGPLLREQSAANCSHNSKGENDVRR